MGYTRSHLRIWVCGDPPSSEAVVTRLVTDASPSDLPSKLGKG